VTDEFLTAERDVTSDLDLLPVLVSLVFPILSIVCVFVNEYNEEGVVTRRDVRGRCLCEEVGKFGREKRYRGGGEKKLLSVEFFLCASLS
jgi:hypothetical protein